LPAGDPRLAAAADLLSREQQAALVAEYQEALSDGRADAWLAEKNLTKVRMARWQSMIGSTQQPPSRPAPRRSTQWSPVAQPDPRDEFTHRHEA
jgi:hypothetical protein